MGRAEVLLAALGTSSRRPDAEEIVHAAKRGAALTHQLLAFSRSQVLRVRSLDLNGCILESELVLRRLAGERHAIVTELSPGLGPIEADSSQIFQVLLNLVANARDAMPEGGRVSIRTFEATLSAGDFETVPPSPGGSFAALEVGDTGAGFDREIRQRMFEPFFTTKVGGTGLGLAVVYGIVAQSGGHLRAWSATGRGSTLTAFFRYAPRPVPGAEPPARPPDRAPQRPRTVLLVEDQRAVRESVRQLLEALGHGVIEAGGGEEALAALRAAEGGPDVLLTDVVMPGMRGPELAAQVRALRPGIPVVFMSGFVEDKADDEIARDPDAGFLAKPFTLDALERELEAVLRIESGPSEGGPSGG
jgi:CheY-like chemotaxis protein